MTYKIVYGETRPAWSQEFATKRELLKFVNRCVSVGDLIFGIEQIRKGDAPNFYGMMDVIPPVSITSAPGFDGRKS